MEIVLFLSGILLTLTIAYLVGTLAFLPFDAKEKMPTQVSFFLKLATGIVGITVLTALFFTKGMTVLAGIPLVYLLVIWVGKHGRQKARNKIKFEWKQLLLTICLVPVFLGIQLYRNDFFNQQIVNCGDVDTGVYATVSEYLTKTGVEVSSPWYQLNDFTFDNAPKPYHYDDLWLLSFILKTTKVSSLDAFYFILIPLLAVIVFFCHFAFLKSLLPEASDKILLLFLFAFLAVAIQAVFPHLVWSYPYHKNTITFPKIAFFPILIVAGWLSAKYRILLVDCFFFCAAAIANILFLPVIFVSFLVFWGLSFYLNRKNYIILKVIILLGAVIYYFLFYKEFGTFQTSCIRTNPPGEQGYLFWIVKIWAALHVKHFIFFAPIYLGLFYLWNSFKPRIRISILLSHKEWVSYLLKSNWNLLTIAFFLFESSALASALMNKYKEYFQISEIIHTTLSGLVILWIIAMLLKHSNFQLKPIYKLIIGVLFFQLLYGFVTTIFLYQQRDSRFDMKFITQATVKLTNKNPLGISIPNQDSLNSFTSDPRMCYFCNFLKLSGNYYWANQITVPEKIEDLKFMERKQAVELSPFYRFIQKQKAEGKYLGYEQAQLDFIERYEVDYVVVEAGAPIPPLIMSCIDTMLEDEQSGVRLVILKKPCSHCETDKIF